MKETSFEKYIFTCKERIRKARPEVSEKIIDWNAPFALTPENPNGKGILLIHGLLESPFAMRDLAHIFQSKGYLVYAVLLPGHGTTPEALLTAKLEEWVETVEFGIKALKQQVSTIEIAGRSTGASLAIYLADQQPTLIKKVYAFAPACGLASKFACLTGLGSMLGKFIPRFRFLDSLEEDDCIKYRSMTLYAAWQVFRLTRKTKHLKLEMPLFFAISEEDETVSFKAVYHFFKRQTNPNNKMLVFSAHGFPPEKQIEVINTKIPEKNILCLSHIGIIYSPDNPYYGEKGEYTLKDKARYQADYYGNVYTVGTLKNGERVSRLFYNPFFSLFLNLS